MHKSVSAIVPVVEGDGEVEAVPVLIRKILREQFGRHDIRVASPKPAHGKGTLLRRLEDYLEYAIMMPECQAVLVLIDADDDCAKELSFTLAHRARRMGLKISVAIVCATREYEAWFLASLESIRGRPLKGRPGLSDSAHFSGPVEELTGVKEWLTQHMRPGRAYKETSDQAPLTEYIDLKQARARSRSFRRLCHALEELVQAMDKGYVVVTPQGVEK